MTLRCARSAILTLDRKAPSLDILASSIYSLCFAVTLAFAVPTTSPLF